MLERLRLLHYRDVSDAKISRFADAYANIKGWRSADANADANIRARRSSDANADANICNIIIIYLDFLPTPRRGSHSHV